MSRGLPERSTAVALDHRILGDEREAFGNRLGYQDSVERVSVMIGESHYGFYMRLANR